VTALGSQLRGFTRGTVEQGYHCTLSPDERNIRYAETLWFGECHDG